MTPFLQQVASVYYKNYGNKLQNLVFVFPNRRSGIFFQKYLAQVASGPLFSPTIRTINELFGELSSLRLIDRTSLLFKFYHIFVEISHSKETFDDFFYWGEMLLNDYDDVDKYVADARQLFTNVTDLKQIDEDFAFLEKDQIEVIRRFWTHFIPSNESSRKEEFSKTWKVLYEIYQSLRTNLSKEGLAYEGMIFREVAEKFLNKEFPDISYEKVVFVGLNALTTSEKILLSGLKEMGIADFYWDYQAPTLRDPDNKASFFAKENLANYPSIFPLEAFSEQHIPEISVIGVPSAIGQAKYAHQLLQDLMNSGDIDQPKHAMNSAIVLPDENLLMPILYAIPEQIDPINVTMGYSLKNTPIAGLMQYIFELQRTVKQENGEALFYHNFVIPILRHRYLAGYNRVEVDQLVEKIKTQNYVFIPQSQLNSNELFRKLFRSIKSVEGISAYLIELLEFLQGGLVEEEENDENEQTPVVTLSQLEKEFIYHYYITVNRLADVIRNNPVELSLNTYFRLLKQLTETITIPFRGEPLSGLQIMGVLETRSLDFENQIILSVNEGVFPLSKAANSFIPYNLRKGFGLSTTEHQDAVFAYHFYRMISRAKKVFLLYDVRTDGLKTGEVSRFIHQLKYHYHYPIQEKTIVYDISVKPNEPIIIEKSERVLNNLGKYLEGGSKGLSASAINTYLNCPLQFYMQYVEGVQEDDDIAETLDSSTYGTIFHGVMQDIYLRSKGKMVTADLIRSVLEKPQEIRTSIRHNFAKHFLKMDDSKVQLIGFNYLIAESLYKYVVQVLHEDLKKTPFIQIDTELPVKISFEISQSRKVNLKGFIDRVDEKDKVVEIIDYKSGGGGGKNEFASMSQLFDSTLKTRPKTVMQVLLYAMIYNQLNKPSAISPKLYYIRESFKEQHESEIVAKEEVPEENLSKGVILNSIDSEPAFRSELKHCLEDIFDKEKPFVQTEIEQNCQYCPFISICKR